MPIIWRVCRLAEIEHLHVAWVYHVNFGVMPI